MVACSEDKMSTIQSFDYDQDEIAERIVDVAITYSDSGRIQAQLQAPLMLRYTSEYDQIEMPEGLHAVFFDRQGQRESELWADYGVRKLKSRITVASGNVKVINQKGDTLLSEHLVWDEQDDRVFTDQYVEIRTPKEIIMADGFESDMSFSSYEFYNIRGIITLEEEK